MKSPNRKLSTPTTGLREEVLALFKEPREYNTGELVDSLKRDRGKEEGYPVIRALRDLVGMKKVEELGPKPGQGIMIWWRRSGKSPQVLGATEAEEPSTNEVEKEAETTTIRERVNKQILRRRGQRAFRNAVRERYDNRCLVTGCQILDLLEAAHIRVMSGIDDHRPENGLLLRADIHTLFDLDLLGIQPSNFEIKLHPDIAADSAYRHLDRKEIKFFNENRPSRESLAERYALFTHRISVSS